MASPQYAEIIFETGSKSLMKIDNMDDAKEALKEQHRRAMQGEPGGPVGQSAERIKEVLLYDEHPGGLRENGLLDTKSIKEAVDKVALGDQVSAWEAIAAIRDTLNPLSNDETAHTSKYEMKESGKLDLGFLED